MLSTRDTLMRLKKVERLRLATLVTIGVCATVVVTMLALLILVDHFATTYARQQAYERLQQLSWQMRDSLDLGIGRVIDQIHRELRGRCRADW